jgi:hypothetical protein
MQRPGAADLVTLAPDLTGARHLGTLGNVAGLNYSDTMPGGNDTLSCTLQMQPGLPDVALNAGRVLRVYKGAGWIWEGQLKTPTAAPEGWTLNAQGAGHYGDGYVAIDSGGFMHADPCIAAAIGRGMRWIDHGVSDTGMWTNQPPDNGTSYITDWLNLITSAGDYTWHVGPWNALQVLPIPSNVTRLLVATTPASPTLNGYFNALYTYYQATADSSAAAGGNALAEAENDGSIGVHGRLEATWDISSAGVVTGAEAALAAGAVLSRYNAASFSDSFTAQFGQYLTPGGTPVNLATERAGEVARLLLTDGGYGGQVAPAIAVTFPVGQVKYDQDAETLDVTPFQSVRNDLGSMLSAVANLLQPPTTPGG